MRDFRLHAGSWVPYALITLIITLLTYLLIQFGLGYDRVNIVLLYLFPVLFSAVYWGIRPSFYAAAVSVLAFDFFFIPPVLSFSVDDFRYLFSFFVYMAVAALTATLAARLKQQLLLAKQSEQHTNSLYALSRQMTAISDLRTLLDNVCRQVSETLDAEIAIYMPDRTDELALIAYSQTAESWGRGESEIAIAKWVYRQGQIAGKGSGMLRDFPGLYVPLKTEERIYGVLAVKPIETGLEIKGSFTAENRRLLEAFGGLTATAIARVKLSEEAKLAHLMAESERIRTALLDSVSHELRTPLATVIGSATGLIEGERIFSSEDRLELLATIRDGALRMNRLVTNLLGMVKLESGMLQLRKRWCDIEDMLGVVLAQVKEYQQHRRIRIGLSERVPFFEGDDVLLEQVLVNVVSNAIKYSSDYSEIEIAVNEFEGSVVITVTDAGIGIAESESELIFDKFYRGSRTGHLPGTGLGLAICKGIVEAHGGTISAEPAAGKGTRIRIALPAGDRRHGIERLSDTEEEVT
ncbi:ATP-binding protein [Paenibacillus montanisoli]|uniref:histidine kinase n=1 Tax=Paenibacillus montanisoli TaxID=2081970 RepID=A0A328TUE2_9BACL|nr:ATP-binding protein [Paenibacillus montanisoli]RAP73182.1 histidine kinase [Paenibacillus montanisoli]